MIGMNGKVWRAQEGGGGGGGGGRSSWKMRKRLEKEEKWGRGWRGGIGKDKTEKRKRSMGGGRERRCKGR